MRSLQLRSLRPKRLTARRNLQADLLGVGALAALPDAIRGV